MDPSSLVLVAIIGVWAAYLVPHWLRSRDELVQSRTRDRFSGGLRVLQRRSRRPAVARSAHRSGDAVLTSPRVIVDADGEYLYIPADRALEARLAAARAATRPPATAAPVGRATPAPIERATAAPVERAAAAPVGRATPAPVERAAAAPVERAAAAPVTVEPIDPEAEMPESPSDLELAIAGARVAARRRALIMLLLLVATGVSWTLVSTSSLSFWPAVPATVLLAMHVLASRAAGVRSRAGLMHLAVQVQSAELVRARPERTETAAPARPAAGISAAEGAPERVARRAAAVGGATWEPVPVPPPTYTLKPAVHRPEPAPLDLPAAAGRVPGSSADRAASASAPASADAGSPGRRTALDSAAAAAPAAAGVSRGALPRRAADIERILALESHLDDLFEEPKVVNG